jgi:hypothetical protein
MEKVCLSNRHPVNIIFGIMQRFRDKICQINPSLLVLLFWVLCIVRAPHKDRISEIASVSIIKRDKV